MEKGRVTIPTDVNDIELTKQIAKLWKADAIRNCDGTKLPKNAKDLIEKVYSTYFVVRGDNKWATMHQDELQSVLLISDPVTAFSDVVEIELLKGYFDKQLIVNEDDYKKFWQVFDRTCNEEVFNYEYNNGKVIIKNAKKYHVYTVNFFAKNIWDSTQMYNYITNNWNCEKHLVMEPRYSKTWEHIKENLNNWCVENIDVNVVRFTTFLYHFFLVFNEDEKEKNVDWFGYAMTASPSAFRKFEEEYGYQIKTEDIINKGTYSNTFVNPTKEFKDYQEFVQKYVTNSVRELVDIVHKNHKEAMMFLGDSWIGTEPYGKYFNNMNLDAIVGSIGGGVTVRMLTDIPTKAYKEGRFLPYFFPDTFFDGNEENAIKELNMNWLSARRAIMRKPLDRIGYGGYLSLACKFPNFVNRVEKICEEFRSIYDAINNSKPYSNLKVAILNSWGKIRSWQCFMVAHELWYQQIYSYQGILESLSGLSVDVDFISFDDVRNDRLKEFDVLINAGDRQTAFSGGNNWNDIEIIEKVKDFVYSGKGFIGIGEPTAIENIKTSFALADVLGVDIEKSTSLFEDKYNIEKHKNFILEDVNDNVDYGEGKKNVYALKNSKVLDIEFSKRFKRNVNVGEVKMAVNNFGKGRSVYIAGLPYSFENTRILLRAMYWAASKEQDMKKCFSSNLFTECSYYESSKKYAIINNTTIPQKTMFYNIEGKERKINLKPLEIVFIND